MKKNLIIALLTIVAVLSLAFGYSQKVRADEQAALAVRNEQLAKEMAAKAEEQMQRAMVQERIAVQSRMEAEQQFKRAEEALQKIKRK